MTESAVTIRRVAPQETAACIEGLADGLIDCVQGGASVSFMWPLPRARALAFWSGVAEGVAREERVLLVAEDPDGAMCGATIFYKHL